MVTEINSSLAFFERSGLGSRDMNECNIFLETHFPGIKTSLVTVQGFCSWTVYLGKDRIIQFRPDNYQLDLDIIKYAQRVLGHFVPSTTYLGKCSSLNVYIMDKIPGISFLEFRTRETLHRQRMCEDFARIFARSWHYREEHLLPKGVVGSSLRERLEMLSMKLPIRFRPKAKHLLMELPKIQSLKWVITHGDLIATNIIIDPTSGRINGLIDWGEGEMLPFGLCFHGLENLLGEMMPAGFSYCSDADRLRELFWQSLLDNIPELKYNIKACLLSRDLGVLLWHGIAFDDGLLNRVVQEGRDDEEIAYLDAFLDLSTGEELDISTTEIGSVLGSGVIMV